MSVEGVYVSGSGAFVVTCVRALCVAVVDYEESGYVSYCFCFRCCV